MARIKLVPPADFPPEVREYLENGGSRSADGAWANRPDLMVPYRAFSKALFARSILAPKLIELVRLRIAFHNQCRSCMARRTDAAIEDGLTEDLVCQLAAPEDGPDLSERDRAALHYADLMATRHLEIGDDTFDRLREHFTEPEIVELGVHCAVFIGFGRLSMSWDLIDALPERFKQRSGPVTPWTEDANGTLASGNRPSQPKEIR